MLLRSDEFIDERNIYLDWKLCITGTLCWQPDLLLFHRFPLSWPALRMAAALQTHAWIKSSTVIAAADAFCCPLTLACCTVPHQCFKGTPTRSFLIFYHCILSNKKHISSVAVWCMDSHGWGCDVTLTWVLRILQTMAGYFLAQGATCLACHTKSSETLWSDQNTWCLCFLSRNPRITETNNLFRMYVSMHGTSLLLVSSD